MDPDEERKRKARESQRNSREKKLAKMTKEEIQIEKEKMNARMAKYKTKPKTKEEEAEKYRKRRAKLADPANFAHAEELRRRRNEKYREIYHKKTMAHHGAKPLAPRGAGIPTDAEDLMGNFVFPVQSESDKDEEDFYLPSDEEHDDFFQHHDFGPGSGVAGMAMAI